MIKFAGQKETESIPLVMERSLDIASEWAYMHWPGIFHLLPPSFFWHGVLHVLPFLIHPWFLFSSLYHFPSSAVFLCSPRSPQCRHMMELLCLTNYMAPAVPPLCIPGWQQTQRQTSATCGNTEPGAASAQLGSSQNSGVLGCSVAASAHRVQRGSQLSQQKAVAVAAYT